jgi:hypothetical protein
MDAAPLTLKIPNCRKNNISIVTDNKKLICCNRTDPTLLGFLRYIGKSSGIQNHLSVDEIGKNFFLDDTKVSRIDYQMTFSKLAGSSFGTPNDLFINRKKKNMEEQTSRNGKGSSCTLTDTQGFIIQGERLHWKLFSSTFLFSSVQNTVTINKNRWYFCVKSCNSQQLNENHILHSHYMESDTASRNLKFSDHHWNFLATQFFFGTLTNLSKQTVRFTKASKQRKMSKQIHKISKFAAHAEVPRETAIEKIVTNFNYPIDEIVKHRVGRSIRSKKVWVQGLPMDIGQIIGLVGILKENFQLPIKDSSKEELCDLVLATQCSPATEKGVRGIDVLGSTSAVAAFVFELEESFIFTAVSDLNKMTVTEVVTEAQVMVRNTGKVKKEVIPEVRDIQITLLVMPWYIKEVSESDICLVLRFFNFSMDAKSDMVHSILQEIAVGLGSESEDLKFFQILPRTVFVDSVPWHVIDVITSNERNINYSNLNAHFTGNAIGGANQLTIGGVHATVLAGNNIQEMVHHKVPPQMSYWATLHGLKEMTDLRYITYLLLASGCRINDICSVIYAKPNLRLRKATSIVAERKIIAKRALADEICTVIFVSQQALHIFITNFRKSSAGQLYPEVQLGFADVVFSNTVQKLGEQHDPIDEETFLSNQSKVEYYSNEYQSEH